MKQTLLALFVNGTEAWQRKSDRDQAYTMMAYGEAPPERGILCRPWVYERVGISLLEVYKRVGKSYFSVFERTQKGKQMNVMAL